MASALNDTQGEAKMCALLVDMLRAPSINKARECFDQFIALHALRPPAFVWRLEQKRGHAR